MIVYYHDGELYTETGEAIEGVMGYEEYRPVPQQEGVRAPLMVRVTLLVEDMPDALIESALEAVQGLEKLLGDGRRATRR